jgi:hypothetical protein
MKQAEVIAYLDRAVFEQALRHGWLRPAVRASALGNVYYSTRDVERVSERIAAGEFPGKEDSHS